MTKLTENMTLLLVVRVRTQLVDYVWPAMIECVTT